MAGHPGGVPRRADHRRRHPLSHAHRGAEDAALAGQQDQHRGADRAGRGDPGASRARRRLSHRRRAGAGGRGHHAGVGRRLSRGLGLARAPHAGPVVIGSRPHFWRFWLLGLAAFLLVVWLLRAILLPFVAGMGVAYLLDPVCDWLERRGLSRTLATTVITLAAGLVLAAAVALLEPLLQQQMVILIE